MSPLVCRFWIDARSVLDASRYATYPLNPESVEIFHPAFDFSAVTVEPSEAVHLFVAES